MAEISRRAGVGMATLYRNFPSRRELLEAFTLGDDGWLKMLRLEDYAARKARRPEMLQQALFPYHEAWG